MIPKLTFKPGANYSSPPIDSPRGLLTEFAASVKAALTPRKSNKQLKDHVQPISSSASSVPPESPRKKVTVRDMLHSRDFSEADLRILFEYMMSCRRPSEQPTSPRSPRPNPVADSPATKEDLKLMNQGITRLAAVPLARGSTDTREDLVLRHHHFKVIEAIQACKGDLNFRWELGVSNPPTKDEEVIWSLAQKQIKNLASLSKTLFQEFTSCEEDLKSNGVLLSPRKPKDADIAMQKEKMEQVVLKQNEIVQTYIPLFSEIAKLYFSTIDILEHRHDNDSLLKKYFSKKSDPLSPR